MSHSLPIFDYIEAQKLRDQGMQIAASYPCDDWVAKARSVAEHIAATEGECTIEMVYKKIGLPPKPNAAGSVFKGKKFRCIGMDEATRTTRHCGMIRRWALR